MSEGMALLLLRQDQISHQVTEAMVVATAAKDAAQRNAENLRILREQQENAHAELSALVTMQTDIAAIVAALQFLCTLRKVVLWVGGGAVSAWGIWVACEAWWKIYLSHRGP